MEYQGKALMYKCWVTSPRSSFPFQGRATWSKRKKPQEALIQCVGFFYRDKKPSAVILKRSWAGAHHPSQLSGNVLQVSTKGTFGCRFIPDCLSSADIQVRNYEDKVVLRWSSQAGLPAWASAPLPADCFPHKDRPTKWSCCSAERLAVTLDLVLTWSLSQSEDITAD